MLPPAGDAVGGIPASHSGGAKQPSKWRPHGCHIPECPHLCYLWSQSVASEEDILLLKLPTLQTQKLEDSTSVTGQGNSTGQSGQRFSPETGHLNYRSPVVISKSETWRKFCLVPECVNSVLKAFSGQPHALQQALHAALSFDWVRNPHRGDPLTEWNLSYILEC